MLNSCPSSTLPNWVLTRNLRRVIQSLCCSGFKSDRSSRPHEPLEILFDVASLPCWLFEPGIKIEGGDRTTRKRPTCEADPSPAFLECLDDFEVGQLATLDWPYPNDLLGVGVEGKDAVGVFDRPLCRPGERHLSSVHLLPEECLRSPQAPRRHRRSIRSWCRRSHQESAFCPTFSPPRSGTSVVPDGERTPVRTRCQMLRSEATIPRLRLFPLLRGLLAPLRRVTTLVYGLRHGGHGFRSSGLIDPSHRAQRWRPIPRIARTEGLTARHRRRPTPARTARQSLLGLAVSGSYVRARPRRAPWTVPAAGAPDA